MQRSLQQLGVVVDENEWISSCGTWRIYTHEIWRVQAFRKTMPLFCDRVYDCYVFPQNTHTSLL